MVSGATSAFISRRLWPAQPRALRKHGVDPGRLAIGPTFTMGHHHRNLSPYFAVFDNQTDFGLST
jgi:hypothetical protein